MKERIPAVMPYDPETGKCYVNAVGSNKAEAGSNLTQIEIEDSALDRIEMINIEIVFERPSGG